jgi:hypothetical protein
MDSKRTLKSKTASIIAVRKHTALRKHIARRNPFLTKAKSVRSQCCHTRASNATESRYCASGVIYGR